jgi:hypothetical protein
LLDPTKKVRIRPDPDPQHWLAERELCSNSLSLKPRITLGFNIDESSGKSRG